VIGRPILRGALPGVLLFLNACASPREHFYLLDQPATENSAVVEKRSTVVVGPVTIPAEIDRPQIVVRKGPFEVTFNEQARWAVPLKEALPRMLAGSLSRNAENTRFVPFSSAAAAAATAQLAIDITRFEVSYEAGATVAIHWAYRLSASNLPPAEGDAVARVSIGNRRMEGLLDALRRALVAAADIVAKQLPADP
jgi:uncharacterized protein